MGILLKVILFGLVLYYIFKTVGGFVLKILGVQSPQQQRARQTQQQKREGEINIEYMPKDQQQKRAGASGSKEGDYIDYEEVK